MTIMGWKEIKEKNKLGFKWKNMRTESEEEEEELKPEGIEEGSGERGGYEKEKE